MEDWINKSREYFTAYNVVMGRLNKAIEVDLNLFDQFSSEENISIMPDKKIYKKSKEISRDKLQSLFKIWKDKQ